MHASLHAPATAWAASHAPAVGNWVIARGTAASTSGRACYGTSLRRGGTQRGAAPEGAGPTLLGSMNKKVASPVESAQVGFPYADFFEMENGKRVSTSEALELVAPFAFDERLRKIEAVVQNRTYNVIPVVENLFDMGNLAAVCRTADALGFGSVHCIPRQDDRYKLSQRTAAGADKWLDVRLWPGGTGQCLSAMKGAGYQVLVTHLTKGSVAISDVDWTKPTAFVLGNEKEGVSEEAVAAADACVIIPMMGFVESFNISVAAALVMYEAQQQRIRKLGRHGDLSQGQQATLKAAMLMRSVRESNTLLGELLNRPPPAHQEIHFQGARKKVAD